MARTYEVKPGEWVVATDGGTWLEGIYDSDTTARRAESFPDSVLHDLRRIYRFDGENRPVTMADLDAVVT